MKHVLISCDACSKTVPDRFVKDWWGLTAPKENVQFAPLTRKTIDMFSVHVCSRECLGKVLVALAQDLDPVALRKAARVETSKCIASWPMPYLFSRGLDPEEWCGDQEMNKKNTEDEEEY